MLVNTYLKYLESENKSHNTIRGHKATLNDFLETVGSDIKALIPRDITKYQKKLVDDGRTVGTINTHVKRLKVFFKWLEVNGHMKEDITKQVKMKREVNTSVKWLSGEQTDLLLRSAYIEFLDRKRPKLREYTVITALLYTGLRVEELTNLESKDVVLNKRFIRVRNGKDGVFREVPINDSLYKDLKAYKEGYTPKGSYLFDTNRSDKMTTRAVNHLLTKFNGVSDSKGKVTIEKLHAHMLRHTFAKSLVNKGVSIEEVAVLLGHMRNDGTPNTLMTARYVKSSQENLLDSVNKLDY
ncbi:tyrosine-type recombinase/integrase [Bacillus sp. SW14]|uniref:tyrosine-type recombinase/integrase n=1 Tax=Bacillus sp. SW14 TaxID=3391618 RepID=UPI0039E26753